MAGRVEQGFAPATSAAGSGGWRASWRLLGSSAALSPVVTLLYLPFGLVGPLIIDPARLGGRWSDWLLVALAGQAALMVVFVLGRLILHRGGTQRSPVSTVVVMVLAILARALILSVLVPVLGLSEEFEIGYRIGSSLMAQLGVLVILAVVVSAQAEHDRQAAYLQAQRTALANLNRTMRARLDETIRTLREEVKRTIDPLIRDVDAELEALTLKSDTASVRESIRSVVEDDLRPLSHRLSVAVDADEALAAPAPVGALPRSPLPVRMPVGRLTHPLVFGLLIALIATSQSLREFTWPIVITFPLVTGVIVGLLMAAVRLVLGRWEPRLVWGISTVALAGGVSLVLNILVQPLVGLPVPRFIVVAGLVAGVIVGALIALYAAVDQRRTDTEQALQTSIDDLMEATSLLRQHSFAARQHLSHVIHGSIQSALYAAALRLATLEEPDGRAIADIRQDITDATARLDEPMSPHVMVIDTLKEIADLWNGMCRVTWTMDHPTVRTIAESSAAAMSIVEVVRECVANAVRHGRAESVNVLIRREAEGRVTVEIVDDGIGIDPAASRGLGSLMLDQMCVSWQRTREGGVTRVVAVIPTSTLPVG